MTNSPVHGRIDGPIVMIGFGSIGKGALPLIERHFEFDQERLRRHRPRRRRTASCSTSAAINSCKSAVTRDNYRELAGPAAHARRRPGFLRQPLGRHLLARPHGILPRDRRALHRHRRRALARLLFRQESRATNRAPTTRCARPCWLERRTNPGGTTAVSCLRRQSRHGVAGSSSRRWSISPPISATRRRSPRPARNGRELAQRLGVKGVHIAERDTQRAKHPKPRGRLRQHLVGRRLCVGGHAAGRTRLGHA